MTNFRARGCAYAWSVILLALLSADFAAAQRGPGSQLFVRYPFDQWAAENAKPQIKWSVRIGPALLSPQQRMLAQVRMTLDADELRKHAGSGQILLFVRIDNSAGRRYQTASQTPVSQLHQGDRFKQLDDTVSAFFLPGDYTISLAVCDSTNGEHTFVRRRFHVAGISGDPLPASWKGLPAVEFVPPAGNPDAWYMPGIRSSIALRADTERPVRVELLVNTTPSTAGSVNMFRQNMELIVPSLRVLIGLNPTNGSIGLSAIDLNRRAVSYRQLDLHPAGQTWNDWLKLRSAFSEFGGATVDASTLAGQRTMLDYFASTASGLNSQADVLIVLSAPVFFTEQEKPAPPDVAPDPRHRVFYISYSPTAIVRMPGDMALSRSGPATADPGPEAPLNIHRPLYIFADDLEHLLKPMGARVFHVSKPEEFRKALGTILDEIGKM